uniref:Uncharacterized protein n=1 Tax=Saimiri boliviensis boliviensis TaxID=39432 RepID=A0A2K6U1B4_SAIBB
TREHVTSRWWVGGCQDAVDAVADRRTRSPAERHPGQARRRAGEGHPGDESCLPGRSSPALALGPLDRSVSCCQPPPSP